MDEKRKCEILARHNLNCAKKYIEKYPSIKLLNFEPPDSIWIEKFYRACETVNSFNSVPHSAKPCGINRREAVAWVLDQLSFLYGYSQYLISVRQHGYLACVEIKDLESTLYEFWEPGLSLFFANKEIGKLFHIFEAEYEYQLYIAEIGRAHV